MTYLEILTDICSRVADPDLDTYKERAKDHFLRAIAMLINEGKYTESDIAGFVKIKDNLNFPNGVEDINALKVFKILDFYMSPGIDKDVIITFIENQSLNKISALETLQPSMYDVFIRRAGGTLYGVNGSTPTFVFGAAASESLTLTFAVAGSTINDDAAGNFATMGFAVGQKLWFVGVGALNVTELTIVSIQDDAGTNDQITVSETILADAAISGVLEGFTVLNMKYIEDIDDSGWVDATDLQAAANFQLTYTFMRTCIDIASKTLLDEVNL